MTVEPAGTKHQHAVYYDSPDYRLARAGASLRHRDDDGWTVKLPGSADVALVRTELHVDGEAGDPPAAALDLVAALVRRAPLELAAHIDTVRHRFVLRGADGEPVAELTDDDVTVNADGRAPKRFREVEVEFVESASPEVVASIAKRLEDAGAGAPQHLSKIARALGPRALDAADLVPPGELDFASTPTEVLRAAISRSTARLLAHDPGVRLGGDAEDIHQARVATRRMRSDLRTFRKALDPGWDESIRDELKWLGGLLGAVRDADVLLERLAGQIEEHADIDDVAGDRLLDVLRAERETARDELLAGMRSDRYLELIERLLAASRSVMPSAEGHDFELELGDLVAKPWRKLRDDVARPRRRSARRRPARGADPRQAGALRSRGGRAGGRQGSEALRVGGRRRPGGARRPPGRGRRRAVAARPRPHRRRRRRVRGRAARRRRGRRRRRVTRAVARCLARRTPEVPAAVDVSSNATVRAAGGIVLRLHTRR